MNTTTTPQTNNPPPAPDWIKFLPSSLLKLDSAPLLGFPPPFPWTDLAGQLEKTFQVGGITLTASDPQWRSETNLFEGMGSNLIPLHLSIASLPGDVCWVFSNDDIPLLMSLLLTKSPEAIRNIESDYQQAFYQFIALEVINALGKLNFDKTLAPHINKSSELPNKPSLCVDISIALLDKTLMGRLILSPEFRQAWKERYAARKTESALLQQISLTVNLEAGRTSLKMSEWSQVNPGDYIILDSCSLDPDSDKGRVMMTIDGIPFFRARIKDGSIKILEYPLYHEMETTMNKNDEPTEEESGMEDENLTNMEEEHFGEELSEEDFEENIEGEPAAQKPAAAQPPKASPGVQLKPSGAPTAQPPQPGEKPKGIPSPQDIPMSVIIEVGRLQMTVKQLMDLQPGNLLDLNIRPENGVDLIVSGKKIAKGELVKLGESLGVRILDIE